MIRSRRTKPRPGRLKDEALAKLRIDCYVRDGGRCVKCQTMTYEAPQERDYAYHMSHKRAKRIGLDTLENVETLCGKCHRTFHNYGPSMTKPCPPKERP